MKRPLIISGCYLCSLQKVIKGCGRVLLFLLTVSEDSSLYSGASQVQKYNVASHLLCIWKIDEISCSIVSSVVKTLQLMEVYMYMCQAFI